MAAAISLSSGRPIADVYGGMSEAEARLLTAYRNGEPDVAERLDHWQAQQLAAFLSVNRRRGAAATSPKSLHPGWGFAGKSVAAQKASAIATAASWKEYAKAQAVRKKTPRQPRPKPKR